MVGTLAATEYDDAALDCLANGRRREIISCLREHGNPMALADLAEEVAARKRDSPKSERSAEEVKRISIDLHHTHLLKLADAEFLSYDVRTNLATLSEQGEQFDPDDILAAAL